MKSCGIPSQAEASDSGRAYGASSVRRKWGISLDRPVKVAPSHNGPTLGWWWASILTSVSSLLASMSGSIKPNTEESQALARLQSISGSQKTLHKAELKARTAQLKVTRCGKLGYCSRISGNADAFRDAWIINGFGSFTFLHSRVCNGRVRTAERAAKYWVPRSCRRQYEVRYRSASSEDSGLTFAELSAHSFVFDISIKNCGSPWYSIDHGAKYVASDEVRIIDRQPWPGARMAFRQRSSLEWHYRRRRDNPDLQNQGSYS